MGYLRYTRAPSTALTNTPAIAVTSNVSTANPTFDIYGDWLAGDDLQFERQAQGGDWSAAIVVHHTVTSGEISGSAISLSLPTLTAGWYECRAKYMHAGGSYSGYSPVENFQISFNLVITNITQVYWTTAVNGNPLRSAAAVPIGTPFATRRLILFGTYADKGNGNTVANVKFNGVAVTLYQSGVGEDLRWMATALVTTGTTVNIDVTYTTGVFNVNQPSLYYVDDALMTSTTPVVTHAYYTGVSTGSLTLATQAGGVAVFEGMLFAGTSTSIAISSSTDLYVFDGGTQYYTNYHANNTLTRSTNITVTWPTTDSDSYLTAWSLR